MYLFFNKEQKYCHLFKNVKMSQPKFSSILRETKLLTFTFTFLKKNLSK